MQNVSDPIIVDPANPTSILSQDPGVYCTFIDATPDERDGYPGVASGLPKDSPGREPAGGSKKGRNLVVCIDGTANQFGKKNTHVVELYSRLVADETQLTYYDSGIGTYVAESNIFTRAAQWVENALDMAIALHHKRITLSAYQWLSENYIPGDRIYLFGFSRGAYQVRIIAGMIKVVGLLRKGNNNQIPFAYQLYLAMMKVKQRTDEKSERSGSERTGPPSSSAKDDDTEALCKQFKRTLCHEDFKVHFVGVWDTVSSIGATRGPSFPETTTGMTHVRAFRHALSLHELRIKFLPEYANGGAGPLNGVGNVKEVWFAGSHSDIGGGNRDNLGLDTFGPPLRWMLYEALEYDLRVKPYQGGWGDPVHTPSMTPVWRIFEAYPWKRLRYNNNATAAKRWLPHLSSGRRIQPGQEIHESAITFLKKEGSLTQTKARVLHEGSWVPLQHHLGNVGALKDIAIERDSQSQVMDGTIQGLESAKEAQTPLPDTLLYSLRGLLSSPVEHQKLIDILDSAEYANLLLNTLEHTSGTTGHNGRSTPPSKAGDALCAVLAEFRARPAGCSARPALNRCLRGLSDPDTRHRINTIFSSITGHTGTVHSVTYSPDGKTIASGSGDSTIRLWTAATGQPIGAPLQGHESWVYSVAFSPDGKRIVSGSRDNTIRLWDMDTCQATRTPLTGHKDYVRSVTFSPDGKLIASGSSDATIRIWDVETGLAVGWSLHGHTKVVLSVAFSPDGRRNASGSIDATVRVWDAKTHDEVRVLRGHSDRVLSVVFSPDGRRVVPGSLDGMIRVWDVETGEGVLGPLRGHTDWVRAVAVSPDGRYIASGSDDRTVRLWDAQTGEAVGEPLLGHTRSITSVAFSPDNRRVVSGSWDNSIMIWEVA